MFEKLVDHHDHCKLKACLVVASITGAEREGKRIMGNEQIRATLTVLCAPSLYFALIPTCAKFLLRCS